MFAITLYSHCKQVFCANVVNGRAWYVLIMPFISAFTILSHISQNKCYMFYKVSTFWIQQALIDTCRIDLLRVFDCICARLQDQEQKDHSSTAKPVWSMHVYTQGTFNIIFILTTIHTAILLLSQWEPEGNSINCSVVLG